MTTASKITMVRIVMVPVFIAIMLCGAPWAKMVGLILFILASLTDSLDGYVARKYNQVSTFGKFVDPLADKLLVMSALLILVEWQQMPCWAAIIVIAREFAVTGLRLIAMESGTVIAAGISGKIKTIVSVLCICLMFTPWTEWVLISGTMKLNGLCCLLIVLTTVWSGAEYFIKNQKLLDVRK